MNRSRRSAEITKGATKADADAWYKTLEEAERATREELVADEARGFAADTQDPPLRRAEAAPFLLPVDQRPQFDRARPHGTMLSPDPRRNTTGEKGQPKLEGYEQDGHVFDAHGAYVHTLPSDAEADVRRVEAHARPVHAENARANPIADDPPPPPPAPPKRIWPRRFAYDLRIHFRYIERQLENEKIPDASSIEHVARALQAICAVGAAMPKGGAAYDLAPLGLAPPTRPRGRPRAWSSEMKQELFDAYRRLKVRHPHWDDQRLLERVLLRLHEERNPKTVKRARDMVAAFGAQTTNAKTSSRRSRDEQRSTARRLLAEGLSKNAIAKQMKVHRRTVDQLLAHVNARLHKSEPKK